MTAFLISFVVSLLAWTLLEYAIHFWLGHLPKGRILISSEHLAHHRDILYFTPLKLKLRGAVPVLLAALLLVGGLLGLAAGLGSVAAIALGWTTYEVLHQSIHVNGPRGRYSRWAARHHLSHHFGLARANYGVTTPLWDWVFGTYTPIERVRVPARSLASVPWLAAAFAPEATATEFRRDYECLPAP